MLSQYLNRFLALVAFHLFLYPVLAQDKIAYMFGPDYKPERKYYYYNYLGSRSTGLIQLAIRNRDAILVNNFNTSSLELENVDELDISGMDRHVNDEGFLKLKSNYYWLLSEWDKSEQRLRLSYLPFDLRNKRLSSSAAVLVETGQTLKGFFTHISPDTSKFLVHYTVSPNDRNERVNYSRIGMHVFDQGMNKLWSKEFVMPYRDSEMQIRDYEVDNNGHVYVLAQVYDTDDHKERRSDERPRYHLELLRFTEESTRPDTKILELNERFVTSSALLYDPMGNIVCAGFYYNNPKANGVDGVFATRIDPISGNTIAPEGKVLFPFPTELLQEHESYRTRRQIERSRENNGDAQVDNLVLDHVIFSKDGSVTVVGEEYYITSASYYNMATRMYTTTYYYNYDNILAMKLSPGGNVIWARKIPKAQTGTAGIGTMSFSHFTVDQNDYFFYMDSPRNTNLEKYDVPSNYNSGSSGNLVCTRIDGQGTVTRSIVLDTRTEKIMLIPTNFRRFSENEVIGRVYLRRGKLKIMKLMLR